MRIEKYLGDKLLTFKEVPKAMAREMIIKNHYSHSWDHTFGRFNIGVFEENRFLGIASYGSLKVPKSFNSLSPDVSKDEVVELNRLWIDDYLGKNAESMLIGTSIKFLKPKGIRLIQSFADGRLGCGKIYQASNFKYYGYHKTEFLVDTKTGRVFHEMVFHTSSRPLVITRNLEALDGRFKRMETRTYRYLYALDPSIKILPIEEPYPDESPYEAFSPYIVDRDQHLRFIENTCNYLFYKTGQESFTFSFDDKKVPFSRKEYENGACVVELAHSAPRPLTLIH